MFSGITNMARVWPMRSMIHEQAMKGPKKQHCQVSTLTTFSRLLTVLFSSQHFWKKTWNSHGIIKDLKLILVEETPEHKHTINSSLGCRKIIINLLYNDQHMMN